MEVILFLLVVVWTARLLVSPFPRFPVSPFRPLVLPLALFIGFILFQTVPLPPALLQVLSPATHEVYSRALPGWPERMPYEDLTLRSAQPRAVENPSPVTLLPTVEEVRKGAPVPHPTPNTQHPTPNTQHPTPSLWRPLSLAPMLTHSDLLKFLAYTALLCLVVGYPFSLTPGNGAEERFLRAVLLIVLCSGLLVVGIGLIQRLTWNGKILWFFVPYDWGTPRPEIVPHATGPFVSHVHFANYLVLILPLAVVGALFRSFVVPQEFAEGFRLFCVIAVFVLLAGILLSLSRGAWIGVAIGGAVLLWALSSVPHARRSALLRTPGKRFMRFALAGFVLLLMLTLLVIGPAGREQVDAQLEETALQETSLWVRVAAWTDSLPMIHDFPLFGVGLGSWQELFPRYQRPPWSPSFFREAHNDYLELLAEVGIIGFALLAWFFWQTGRWLLRGLNALSAKTLPVFAALLAALGIMTFHEFFDFNLQIPANAFLFTLFLGIALRMTGSAVRSAEFRVQSAECGVRSSECGVQSSEFRVRSAESEGQRLNLGGRNRFQVPVTIGVGAAACGLLLLALEQESLPYPYSLRNPTTFAEARALLGAHPARSATHLALFRLLEEQAPLVDRMQVLESALWLDPRNPSIRDRYAISLLQQGREEEGLRELRQSVFLSPSLSTHGYLRRRLMPWFSAKEQHAIEEGLRQAATLADFSDEGAVSGLGTFYNALGRFAEEGELYEEAARREEKAPVQVRYLLNAGLAYARAGNGGKAEMLLRQATVAAPQDPRAYQYLVLHVFAPQADLATAKTVIAAGIEKGADPLSLYLGLAEAARKAGDREEAKAALQQLLALRPSAYEAYFRLGLLYLQEKNFGRAALALRKAVDLDPHSAVAFYHLGTAEEGRYQFFAAEKAYAQAIALAPENASFQQRYEALRRKVAENKER
jgi:O-antigen ligase/tetratricopeptide (TPR) repeat protein